MRTLHQVWSANRSVRMAQQRRRYYTPEVQSLKVGIENWDATSDEDKLELMRQGLILLTQMLDER